MKHINFEIGTRLDLGRRTYVINDEGPTTRVLMDLETGDLRLLSLAQLRTAQLLGGITFPFEFTIKPAEAVASDREALAQLRALNAACPTGFVVVRRKDLSDLVRGLEVHSCTQRQSGLWASGNYLGMRRHSCGARALTGIVRHPSPVARPRPLASLRATTSKNELR